MVEYFAYSRVRLEFDSGSVGLRNRCAKEHESVLVYLGDSDLVRGESVNLEIWSGPIVVHAQSCSSCWVCKGRCLRPVLGPWEEMCMRVCGEREIYYKKLSHGTMEVGEYKTCSVSQQAGDPGELSEDQVQRQSAGVFTTWQD